MCQKQCRDNNSFKCHCMNESHQRQMQIFGDNPDRIVGGFSKEFKRTFLNHMRRSHRFSRIAATVIDKFNINDRHHVHMNSTKPHNNCRVRIHQASRSLTVRWTYYWWGLQWTFTRV